MRAKPEHGVMVGEAPPPVTGESTMRAIVQEGYGSADVMRLARIAVPGIGGSDVLVRVHAAGIDRGTWHLMTGRPYLLRLLCGLRGPRKPVPGLDVAGTVAAVGSDVTRFSVGDEVYGFGRGTFADFTVARESKLARKRGWRVGSYAVQLAKALGAEVAGVCGTAKLDFVRSLGATHVIDYATDDFAGGARHFDLIIDIAGSPRLSRLRRALTPTGTAVIVGGESGGCLTGMSLQFRALAMSPFLRQWLTMLTPRQRASDLDRLTTFIEGGTMTASIAATYPLEQVPEAMRYLEAGKVRGKVAITI